MKDKKTDHILYLVTGQGHIQSVQLSSELWSQVEDHVKAVALKMSKLDDPFDRPQPLDALQELKDCWDFTYPYESSMHCESCGVKTEDWENDPAHPFHLTNANIGGLVVLLCRCGATVRKKHFHRKVAYECTPKQL